MKKLLKTTIEDIVLLILGLLLGLGVILLVQLLFKAIHEGK